MSQNSYFRNISFSIIIIVFALSAVILITAIFLSAEIFRILFIAFALFLFIIFLLLIAGFLYINKTIANNDDIKVKQDYGAFFMTIALRLFMPFLLFISNTFNYRKDEIRRIYIKANNEYILSLGKKINPGKLLAILPHCLQWSECSYRIRNRLDECRQCDGCNLGKIKELAKKHGVMVTLATGGTSARKAVKDLKPHLVVAVACERDLSSGIMDVKGVPVYGIINDRPNGPCKDTLVDTEELETVLKHFTKEQD